MGRWPDNETIVGTYLYKAPKNHVFFTIYLLSPSSIVSIIYRNPANYTIIYLLTKIIKILTNDNGINNYLRCLIIPMNILLIGDHSNRSIYLKMASSTQLLILKLLRHCRLTLNENSLQHVLHKFNSSDRTSAPRVSRMRAIPQHRITFSGERSSVIIDLNSVIFPELFSKHSDLSLFFQAFFSSFSHPFFE